MLLHPVISWYNVCFSFVNCFWNHSELGNQKFVFKGVNYLALARFLKLKIMIEPQTQKKIIMKRFKRRLLKHTYGDPQQGPRKQFSYAISDRVLFNQTNNQPLAVLMWYYLSRTGQMYVQLLETIWWVSGIFTRVNFAIISPMWNSREDW